MPLAPDPAPIEARYDGPLPTCERPDPGRRRMLFACHAALAAEARACRDALAEAARRQVAIERTLEALWRAIAEPVGA